MNNEMVGFIENEIGRSLLTLNDLLDLIHIVCYHIFAWFAPWQKRATDFILDVTLHFIVHVTSVFLNISSFFYFCMENTKKRKQRSTPPNFWVLVNLPKTEIGSMTWCDFSCYNGTILRSGSSINKRYL